MKCQVTLRDTQNGYQGTIVVDHTDFDLADWMWTQGNYSCDCNRSLFLYDGDITRELPCNTDNNVIELVALELYYLEK